MPNSLNYKPKVINSMFGPKLIATYHSQFSGEIRVMQSAFSKSLYVATGPLTQTGGIIKDLWSPVIKKLMTENTTPSNILVLGLAGGTLAAMLSKSFPTCAIVGVEIDPVIIEIGKKYLDMDKIPNLQIVVADANKYILASPGHTKFDLIFVDMYTSDQFPDFVYKEDYISALRNISVQTIINHLYYDADKKNRTKQLIETCSKYFSRVELVRSLSNLIIIASS